MLPVIPQQVNELLTDPTGQPSTYPFPQNVAALIPKEIRQKIMQWMLQTYIWPQVMERKPYEATWDKLLEMARATWKYSDLDIDEGTRMERKRQNQVLSGIKTEGEESDALTIGNRMKVADTVIFDAVDRLTNLNHFISFKESFPARYEIPEDLMLPHENDVYSPMSSLVKSANAWLKFNALNGEVYRKGWMTARHHYTYGMAVVDSQYSQKVSPVTRKQANGQWVPTPELTNIGISFEPISIRKLWLNYRLPVYKMEYQPCPFYFQEMPRFAIIANRYDPMGNPMGYVNLESIPKAKYLFGSAETSSLETAFKTVYPNANLTMSQLMDPEYNVELKWMFYPVIPLAFGPPDPNSATPDQPSVLWEKDAQGNAIPLKRYIMETFGNNLINGNQEIIKLQENFYPDDMLPLYGSSHMPTLDDGAYPSAIGSILEGHYRQICKALEQFLENKDWNNDPPTDIMVGSPSISRKGINKAGSRNPVVGPHDITRREPFDTGNTTLAYLEHVRGQAQTSSKSTDAILGKAMGSRTSATEAQNVFQTAMSGVTTDVNLYVHDIYGGYADRVWAYTGRWVDPDVLRLITGSYGFAIKPEHFAIRFGLKWDSGSQFIESITRQSNIQYLLQACPPGDPTLNRAYLFEELLTEWKFKNVKRIVNDGGQDEQIQLATEQAVQTYLGMFVMVDPSQDHNIAIKVKTSFLKDRISIYNTDPTMAQRGQLLVKQIEQHQQWLQLQMQQQMLMQQQQMMMSDPNSLQPLQNPNQPAASSPPRTPGQQRQTTGQ